MEALDYAVISQNLRIVLGLGVNFFSWSFWTIAAKPYKPRPVVKVEGYNNVTEYESMKKCCIDNGLSIKELRSRLKNPYRTLSADGLAFYLLPQWEAQGKRHIVPVQVKFKF